jgi:GT2 family glycosyltransferase
MATQPAVSVIMPVYNAEPFLQMAIESVLRQSFTDFELIVVNDGSSDGSQNVIARFGDRRMRLVNQINRGQSAAINRGVLESHGHYVRIVDADDWLSPRHLENQLHALSGFANAVSACRWGYFSRHPECPDVRPELTDRHYDAPIDWIVDSLLHDEGMMGGWRWLIPRSVWDLSGGYDERLSLNNDFHASVAILLASSGVRFAADACYSYRKAVSGALSATRSRKAMESALLTTQLGCNLLLQREDSPRVRRLCADRFQRWLYEFYPEFPDLALQAESAVASLGGSSVAFPGGAAGRGVSMLLGWKNTRCLQQVARRLGWSKILRIKAGIRNRRLR